MKGIITFNGYKVDTLNYERTYNFDFSKDSAKLTPEFLIYKTESIDDPSYYNLIFGVRIGQEEGNLPFKAEVILRGFFCFNSEDFNQEEYEIDDYQIFTIINGSAILYPYLRSVLTDLTSKSNHNPVILPTINFNEFIRDKELNELLIDSEYYEDIEK
ncbi:protein-export chaperone SecB [Bacillus sp. XZ-5]|uniref:protein-export chaperone SecB n=1 Tax=Bacillus sp. XZ-5 TaxID=3132187 RepID=UPI00307E4CDC